MRFETPPPETLASEIADSEGRVRVFYRVRDAVGNEYEGSLFIYTQPGETVAFLDLEAEEFAYAVASGAGPGSGSPDVTEVVDAYVIAAVPTV